MKITVIGSGYVGLVTGTCLAEVGNQVICVDVDEKKVQQMKAGKIPIYEPGLEEYFKRNVDKNRLTFTTSLEEGILNSDILFLALPTPPDEDGSADLSYILKVADQIGKMITEYKIIVNKSTVPVTTADKVRETISKHTTVDFDVVSNPEFLREGLAVNDFMKPDRIVIGSKSQKAIDRMIELYKPFVSNKNQIIIMDERSSELTKYAANSFLAMKITFMNEMANVCERTGANIEFIKKGLGTDSRISSKFLNAGIGVGGSCFPKDIKALIQTAKEYNYDFEILRSVDKVNNRQKIALLPKLLQYFNGNIKNKRIAVWGLAFKPNTDDIREAPSLYIIQELLKNEAKVVVYDPEAMKNVQQKLGNKINYAKSAMEAVETADALLICTEWEEFKNVSINQLETKVKAVFDGRNIFKLEEMKKSTIHYESIGR
ncbi:MAG: UDP-glucose dehydrogenase family protein [Flavobacteriales bacterium]